MTDLQRGWEYPAIEDILQPLGDGRLIHQGWSPQCERTPTHAEGEWGVLKTTAIQVGDFLPHEHKRLPDSLEPRPVIEVREGDLLVTCAGPRARCGVACLVRRARPRLMLSGKMYRFRVDDRLIDPRFVEAMLCSPDLQFALDEIKTGGSDSGLNMTHARFRSLRLPLPPTAEQERIVTAIEEAFSKLDAGEVGLRTVRQRLKRMRDAVLAAAVTGRLVPQDPTDTPAPKLLADLGIEPIAERDDIPDGWARTVLRDVAEWTSGGTPRAGNARYYGGSIPWAVIGDLTEGVVRQTASSLTEEGLVHSSAKLVPAGTIMLAMYGASIGRIGIAATAMATNQAIACTRPCTSALESAYLFWYLRSQRSRFVDQGKGAAQPNISQTLLKAWPIAIPPVEEQRSIAREVDRQFSFIEACERAVDAGLARSAALRRSVLKTAFEGRLVPQDPSDEPASAVLVRIRADRAGEPWKGRHTRQVRSAE